MSGWRRRGLGRRDDYRARSSAAGLTIDVVVRSGACTLTLSGELDLLSGPAIGHAMSELGDRKIDSIALDLSGVAFIDSSGVQALLDAASTSEAAGRTFRVRRVSSRVQHVLEVTRVLGRLR